MTRQMKPTDSKPINAKKRISRAMIYIQIKILLDCFPKAQSSTYSFFVIFNCNVKLVC